MEVHETGPSLITARPPAVEGGRSSGIGPADGLRLQAFVGSPAGMGPADMLRLQRLVGNAAVTSVLPEANRRPAAGPVLAVQRQTQPGGSGAGGGGGGTDVQQQVAAASQDWILSGWVTAGRTLLEVSRPVPIWGMMGGFVSDSLGALADMDSIPEGNPLTYFTIAVRDAASTSGNFFGSAASADQKIQDVISVTPAAPLDAVTAAANNSLLTVKGFFDIVVEAGDILALIEVHYDATQGPKDEATQKQWNGLFKAFEASIVVDTIGTALDWIDIAAGGLPNMEGLKEVAGAVKAFLDKIRPLGLAIRSIVLNELGIHGIYVAPGLNPPTAQRAGGGDDAVAKAAALDALIAELQGAQAIWRETDANIGNAENDFRNAEAQLRDLIAQVNGGKDPFIQLRDTTKQALDKATKTIDDETQLGLMATKVYTQAQSISAGTDSVLDALAKLVIPEIHLPAPSGDGIVADIEAGAASVADSALQMALTPIRAEVDEVRTGLTNLVQDVKSHSQEIADFNKSLQETCAIVVQDLQQHVTTFSGYVARAQNFEGLIDAVLKGFTDALGITGGIGLDDVRAAWADVGESITWGITTAQGYRAQLEAPKPVQMMTEELSLPPPPPEDEGADGGEQPEGT